MTSGRSFFFAGGGTGGHIYPGVAVAEQLLKLEPQAETHFFCSNRRLDSQILSKTPFGYTVLPAKGFSARPGKLIEFCHSMLKSSRLANKALIDKQPAVVIGIGGYVAAPLCWSAQKRGIPVVLVNVDIIAGKANRIIARWAEEIFVQFDETLEYFSKSRAHISAVGCPLRDGFNNPQPQKAIEQLGLAKDKNILLVTGASSGSVNINNAVCSLLDKLSGFADDWQIVHIAGADNYDDVRDGYENAGIDARILSYYDDMPNLLNAAELVVGRSGAVSIAEYAAASVAGICIPYPYHKDRHQYLNAEKLVRAGAGIIVDDLADNKDTSEWLAEELQEIMSNDVKRRQMKKACSTIAKKDAACIIAKRLLAIASNQKTQKK